MKVKEVHFIDTVPGQPVYIMENGEMRLPFPSQQIGGLMWLTEAEFKKAAVDQTPENLKTVLQHFENARKIICKVIVPVDKKEEKPKKLKLVN